MAEKNGTPVEIYSEDIETLSYTFAQVQKAFADVIHPDMVHTEGDSPNSLKMIVKNNFQTINNLVNKLGTGDIVFDEDFKDIQTAILKLWDWYKKDAGESDDITSTEKIAELMNIVGIAFENGFFVETDDENSLINKVESIIRARPERGILANRIPRKNVYFEKEQYNRIIIKKPSGDEPPIENFNRFVSFENVKVVAEKTYTISLPVENVYSLWCLKTYANEDGSIEIKPLDNITESIALEKAEFTVPKDVEFISISFMLNSIEDFYIKNIVIEEKYKAEDLLKNLNVSDIVSEKGKQKAEAEELIALGENVLVHTSELQQTRDPLLWQLSVPYTLNYYTDDENQSNQGRFTVLNIPVESSANYSFGFFAIDENGEKVPTDAKVKTIHYLNLDKNNNKYESIGIELCSEYQERFWTRPNTTHVSITFSGDSGQVKLYQDESTVDNTMFRERTEQDYSVGATLSLNKDAENYEGNKLYSGEKFQAIKGLEGTGIKWDSVNTLRLADLNSNYNFYVNKVSGDDASTYEVKIIKSGYYMVAGQLGFSLVNQKADFPDSQLDLRAAIMLKNTEELPYRTLYHNWNLSHTNETLISLSNSFVNLNKNSYKATVQIPPKIVQLKAGDCVYLKGSFLGGWPGSDQVRRLRMDHEKHSTYLTVLKLKDISSHEPCKLILKPYCDGTEGDIELIQGASYTIIDANTKQLLKESNGTHNRNEVSIDIPSGTKIEYDFSYGDYFSEKKDFLVIEDETLFVPLGYKITHKHVCDKGSNERFTERVTSAHGSTSTYEVAGPSRKPEIFIDDGILVPGFIAYRAEIACDIQNVQKWGQISADPYEEGWIQVTEESDLKFNSGKRRISNISNNDIVITHYYREIT